MVGIKIKPIVGGGMTSHQWMRVFDLSLPETQTQLLSKIESNDSTLCTFSLLCITYTQKGGGQLANEHIILYGVGRE